MIMYATNLELELVNEEAAKLKEIAFEVGAFLQSDTPIYRLASGKMSDHYFDRTVLEENKKLGIPTPFSLKGKIYYLMPDDRIVLKLPRTTAHAR